jgi:hypothetical protein
MVLLRVQELELDLRHSVAHRIEKRGALTLVYLSLLHDEIDQRVDEFLTGGANPALLEPTDAVVFVQEDKPAFRVARGACCTVPLYRHCGGVRHRVATHLPLASEVTLSASGLLAAAAAAANHGSFEPNALVVTPVVGWNRLRRGVVTAWNGTLWHEAEIIPAVTVTTEADIAAAIREAFEAFARSQRHVRRSVVELSGGYDSTLAAAAALSNGHEMLGASVEFPYYEFRHEGAVQRAVGSALGIRRHIIDGNDLLPYSSWQLSPRFDEPSGFVTGIRHAECVGELARMHNATRIYTGHGGDSVFAVDLTGNEPAPSPFARGAFTSAAWRTLRTSWRTLAEPRWVRRASGCFVYDARQDIWAKERFGALVRTPFTDGAFLRAGLAWSHFSRIRGVRPDKTILRQAVPELLPSAVVNRRGKVAYNGVWARGYMKNADHICDNIEPAASALERVGFSPKWLVARCRSLSQGESLGVAEVLAGYSIAVWLRAWDLGLASIAP